MTTYTITKIQGYKCLLEVEPYEDYLHVIFSSVLETPQQPPETRRQFEMFLESADLQRLITALTMTQYNWHQHNTTEKQYERS